MTRAAIVDLREGSLGDRACLALAAELGAPPLTADQAWSNAEAGVTVEVIRG